MEWYEILSLVIGLSGIMFGMAAVSKFSRALKLLTEISQALLKAGEVFFKSAEALKDRKITKAEAVLLVKAWQDTYSEFVDVYAALLALLPANIIKFLFRR